MHAAWPASCLGAVLRSELLAITGSLIDTAVGTMSSALLQAVVLVIILLAAFLGNLRAAIVVSLSLPLAALATFFHTASAPSSHPPPCPSITMGRNLNPSSSHSAAVPRWDRLKEKACQANSGKPFAKACTSFPTC